MNFLKRSWHKVTAFFAALALGFGAWFAHVHAQAPSVTLTWTAPTQNTDGTAITQSLTYNVYQGPKGAEAATPVATGVTALTWSGTAGLQPGTTVCWEVTAQDSGGESAKSAEVCKTFAPSVPNPPSNLTEQ